jgi:hypothetical protein
LWIICQGWHWTSILLISASQETRFIGKSHLYLATLITLILVPQPSRGMRCVRYHQFLDSPWVINMPMCRVEQESDPTLKETEAKGRRGARLLSCFASLVGAVRSQCFPAKAVSKCLLQTQ